MKVRESIELQKNHPNYGKIEKTPDGRLVCHICGRAFKKLGAHIVQAHGVTSWEYKVAFGLDVTKGLVTDEHRQHLRDLALRNYEVSIKQNLIEGGLKTRFQLHSRGRLKSVLSEQTRLKLTKNFKR